MAFGSNVTKILSLIKQSLLDYNRNHGALPFSTSIKNIIRIRLEILSQNGLIIKISYIYTLIYNTYQGFLYQILIEL